MKLLSRVRLIALCVTGIASAVAQSTSTTPSNATLAATEAALPSLVASLKGPDATRAAAWITAADTLKAFSDAHLGTADAGEARALEAQYLIRAAEAGDITQAKRLADLVASVRVDPSITVHSRFLVASLDNRLGIEQTPKLTHVQRLAAYERSARDMIASFSTQPLPYWALVNLARDATDETTGVALAKEVAAMPGAPPGVKAAAQALVARVGLLGKPVTLSFSTDDGKLHGQADYANRPVVIYTWRSNDRQSMAVAAKLAVLVDPNAGLIGISLDWNMPTARAVVSQAKLPGEIAYGLYGAGGLAAGLHATDAGRVYLIDGTGVLRNDRAEFDLANGLRGVGALKGGIQ